MRGGDTPTGQRPTVRQRQAAARREQILNKALKLFAAQGFPTKASLLTALLENRRSFRSELRVILDGAEDRPAPEVLREVASGWLATLRRDAELVVLFITAQTNPEVNEAMQQVIGEGTSQVSGYLKVRIDANELREDLPLQTAVAMFFSSLMIFFLTRRHLPEPELVKQGDAYARELISVWLEGARR